MSKHEAEAAVRDAYGGLSRLALSLTDDQAWVADRDGGLCAVRQRPDRLAG
jgi:hypothetical protein